MEILYKYLHLFLHVQLIANGTSIMHSHRPLFVLGWRVIIKTITEDFPPPPPHEHKLTSDRGCCSRWVGEAAAVGIGGRGCHGPAEERGQYRPAEERGWCSPVVGGRGCFFPQSLQQLKQGVKSKEVGWPARLNSHAHCLTVFQPPLHRSEDCSSPSHPSFSRPAAVPPT